MSTQSVSIPLRARDGSVRAYAIIDAADADWVNQWRWCLTPDGYAQRMTRDGDRRGTLRLHRALLGCARGDGFEVDHINRNRLDNRRANLRVVTKAENRQNVLGTPTASSKYRGVSWDRRVSRWRAQVQSRGRNHFFGYFDSEIEAAEAARIERARLLNCAVDGRLHAAGLDAALNEERPLEQAS